MYCSAKLVSNLPLLLFKVLNHLLSVVLKPFWWEYFMTTWHQKKVTKINLIKASFTHNSHQSDGQNTFGSNFISYFTNTKSSPHSLPRFYTILHYSHLSETKGFCVSKQWLHLPVHYFWQRGTICSINTGFLLRLTWFDLSKQAVTIHWYKRLIFYNGKYIFYSNFLPCKFYSTWMTAR